MRLMMRLAPATVAGLLLALAGCDSGVISTASGQASVASTSAPAPLAGGPGCANCPRFVDADGDGVCDRHGQGPGGGATGCPGHGAGGAAGCPGFVDADGDGVCDRHGQGPGGGAAGCPGHGAGGAAGCPGHGAGGAAGCPGFVDADGDGVCDHHGQGPGGAGKGCGCRTQAPAP